LPRGNRSRAKNNDDAYGKQYVLNRFPAHNSFSFPAIRPGGIVRYYLLGDTTPAGFVVQNAVNGVVKEQKQPLTQGWVALHVPPQVVELLALLRNCRAETVPAQRTTATIVAINVVFISFLLMLVFLSYSKPEDRASRLLQHRRAGNWVRRAKWCPRLHWEDAEAATLARVIHAAATAACGKPLGAASQLPGGNRSCTENG
jgi:hypothetical protein